MTSPPGTPGQVDPEPSNNNSHNQSTDNTQTETANKPVEKKTVDAEQIVTTDTHTSEIAESSTATTTVHSNNNRCIQSTNSKGNKISCLIKE